MLLHVRTITNLLRIPRDRPYTPPIPQTQTIPTAITPFISQVVVIPNPNGQPTIIPFPH